jgi:uncharacterized protein
MAKSNSQNDQIFIDTLYVVALVNSRDQYHDRAVSLSLQLENESFVITDSVLLEIGNALARNYKAEATSIIESFLGSDDVAVVFLTPELFKRSFELYRSHQDKSWGIVDCISFTVMQDLNISRALTCDRHFAQAGFHTLL